MQQGFTLIEIIIVITIISLMAGLAVPSIVGVQYMIYDIQLEGAAKVLAADLRWLQQAAINGGFSHYYALIFNVYTKPQIYYITDKTTVTKKTVLHDISVANMPASDIIFSASGAPNQGHTIILKHIHTGKTKELTIVPATGRVMVK